MAGSEAIAQVKRSVMNRTLQIFDQYANSYEEKFNQNPLGKYQRARVQAEIASFLSSAGHILDVGCGPGSDFEFYRQLNLTVDAIDISGEMCKLARQKAARLKLNAGVKKVALRDFHPGKRYDAIILNFGVANALANLPEILEKLDGMLAKNGVLIIVAMPPFQLFAALEALFIGRLRSLGRRVFQHRATLENGFDIYYYRRRDFTQCFRLIRRIHLAHLLPTPDQYQRSGLAKRLFKLLLPLDRATAKLAPDFWGGDHVCYVLRKKTLGVSETSRVINPNTACFRRTIFVYFQPFIAKAN